MKNINMEHRNSLDAKDDRKSLAFVWQAPSNIALIKYWGKHGNQLPNNPSLSITLNKAFTTTKFQAVTRKNKESDNSVISLEYLFEGERLSGFENRIRTFLEKMEPDMPFLSGYHITAESSNTFPHSAGIASSASSMAALALCLTSLEQYHTDKGLSENEFYRRASIIARLGSGSASRSVYGGWVSWGKAETIPVSSDEYASPLRLPVNSMFQNPGVAILVASSAQKSLSSSFGHQLMDQHPFARQRYEQAHKNMRELLKAMEAGDFDEFAHIVENEALTLHSLLMTSSPEGMLIKPASLQIIEAVRNFRKTTGTRVCFTMDAGPNVLLIYPIEEREKVIGFINNNLIGFCENGRWLDDGLGEGPKRSKN
jgi:diphosphomevalonate decarboxylase